MVYRIKYPKTISDQAKLILMILRENTKTRDEIFDVLKQLSIQFGVNVFLHDVVEFKEFSKADDTLEYLTQKGIIKIDEKNVYSLTEIGLAEAQRYTRGVYYFVKLLNLMMQPFISPFVSLIFHLFLGIFKIFGYFLTSSVSLLSDGLDSVMDVVSAIVIGISMKIKKERLALYLLLFLMVLAGLEILFQGFSQLFLSNPLEKETVIIIIALISIISISLLYFYQRISGYRNRNLTILAQSEDSKNHLLNASLVLLAAIAGFLGFYFIDGLVAIFIGFFILRGAYELSKDIRRQEKNENINFEKYKLGMWKKYDKMQSEILSFWILYTLKDSKKTILQIIEMFNKSFRPITVKHTADKKFSLSSFHNESILQIHLKELINNGLLIDNNSMLSMTEKGKIILSKEISKQWHRIKPFGDRKGHFHIFRRGRQEEDK